MTKSVSTLQRMGSALGQRPDETILRAIFYGLIAATIVVAGLDLRERMHAPPRSALTLNPEDQTKPEPFLPSVTGRPADPAQSPRNTPEALREAMKIELVSGGRLEAIGTITPGTAERFRAEIEKRGDYVKTVVLSSPGGSVQDALAMGKLIREKGLATRVEANAHCASSCPLVFSGGVSRSVGEGASVGVHQMIPVGPTTLTQGQSIERIQAVSAECQRHMIDMGVDARVWTHAMETPPQEMFYFSRAELKSLQLINDVESSPVASSTRKKG